MPRGRATGTLQGSGVSVVGLTGGAGSNRLTERGDESTQLMPAGGCGGTHKVLPRPQRDGSLGKRVRKNAPGGVVFHASEQGSSQVVRTKKMKRRGRRYDYYCEAATRGMRQGGAASSKSRRPPTWCKFLGGVER
jgi:hypothetical protein